MKQLKVLAFTHKHIDLQDIGKFVICNQSLQVRLNAVKEKFEIPEIFYVGTCNRVEFVLCTAHSITPSFIKEFVKAVHPELSEEQLEGSLKKAQIYEDEVALEHLMRVSCSLESLVVGEKEILAQVRKSYECCKEAGFTGDFMRLIMTQLVKTAKEVYTDTKISKNPISVVSLAYRKLRDLNMCANARILIIGAGETNQNIAKYLQKHRYSNFAVFNRSIENSRKLAAELNGEAYSLEDLKHYKKGFDAIITCTSATEPIITNEIYQSLLNGETDKKVIVDLAVPNDTHPEVLSNNPIHFIEVKSLQEVANQNMQERYAELVYAEEIISKNIEEFKPLLRQRRIELAMKEVPLKIKEIKRTALDTVFAEEVGQLDEASKDTLEKILSYMEKKYISVPMIMAKEILVNNS